jgi:hypothetical protein
MISARTLATVHDVSETADWFLADGHGDEHRLHCTPELVARQLLCPGGVEPPPELTPPSG